MEVLYLTIPISILLAATFLFFFIVSVRGGQFEQVEKQKMKIFDVTLKKDKEKNEN